MKISSFLLILCVFQVFAGNSYSQHTRLTLDLSQVPVNKVLSEIEDQSEFFFLYNHKLVDVERMVNIHARDEMIKDILDELFADQGVQYLVVDRQIILSPMDITRIGGIDKLSALEYDNESLQGLVRGQVSDDQNKPLMGVTVLIKGTTIGTITDADGNYSVEIPRNLPDPVLVFSFIGMKTQEIAVGTQSVINVVMAIDAISLDEIVAVGYGTKSKLSVTGSITEVKNDVISRKISTNVMGNLMGYLPGLVVTRKSGTPGSEGYNFVIRGASSLNTSSALIIIDGVFSTFEQLQLLNPQDIENISVLKDASAAIYGARAANGVMLVTTKKGSGKMTINYRGRFASKRPAIIKAKANTNQALELNILGNYNDNNLAGEWIRIYEGLPIDNTWGEDNLGNWIWRGSHDWETDLYGNAPLYTHDLSISGSGDRNSYMLSVGFMDESSMLQWGNNSHKRYNIRLNYGYDFSDNLTLSSIVSVTRQNLVEPRALWDKEFYNALSNSWPQWPLYAESYSETGLFYNSARNPNPAAACELGGDHKLNANDLGINLKLEYKFPGILSGLKLTGQAGINYISSIEKAFSLKYYTSQGKAFATSPERILMWPLDGRNYVDNRSNTQANQTYMAYLNYDKTLGVNHRIGIMAGVSNEQQDNNWWRAWRYNMLTDELHTLNLGASDQQFNDESASAWALSSLFSRVSYSFMDKYFLDGTYRYDGSSKFAGDQRWRPFFSASAGWAISNEEFIRNLGFVDLLKVRLSYGESGNQGGIGLYDYVQLLTISGQYPFGVDGQRTTNANLSSMVSRARTWEKVSIQNLGLDFGFLNGRLSGTVEFFKKTNQNMLISITYPVLLGATAPKTNSGELETRGWEAMINWSDRIGNFSYYIRPQISDSKNELVDLAGADTYSNGVTLAREGYPINSLFLFRWDGYIETDEELAEYKQVTGVPATLLVGSNRYKDLDNNGKMNAYGTTPEESGDMDYCGHTGPRYIFGISLGASYKNFDLGITLQGVGKQLGIITTLPGVLGWVPPFASSAGNTWTPENKDAIYPVYSHGFSATNAFNYFNQNDHMLYNGRYIRLKDIQLGWTINAVGGMKLLHYVGIEKMRIYASGTDLWEAHEMLEGFDPEKESAYDWGEGTFGVFPRILSFGIDVTF